MSSDDFSGWDTPYEESPAYEKSTVTESQLSLNSSSSQIMIKEEMEVQSVDRTVGHTFKVTNKSYTPDEDQDIFTFKEEIFLEPQSNEVVSSNESSTILEEAEVHVNFQVAPATPVIIAQSTTINSSEIQILSNNLSSIERHPVGSFVTINVDDSDNTAKTHSAPDSKQSDRCHESYSSQQDNHHVNLLSGDILKRGLLWKRSRNKQFFSRVLGLKNWKQRTFLLKDSQELLYFEPGDEDKLKGRIIINDVVVRSASAENSHGRSNVFEIITADQEVILLASNDPKEAASWMMLLEQVGNR